jgi:hypothetical protein
MHVEQVIPVLRIFDVVKAKEFYVDFLGFAVEWEHQFEGIAPRYIQITRDGCTLHLTEHHGDCCPGSTVFVRMTGLREFHAEISAKNYAYGRPGIDRMPWDMDQMQVHDPFGNRVRFCEAVAA